jgi:hypothetical protein
MNTVSLIVTFSEDASIPDFDRFWSSSDEMFENHHVVLTESSCIQIENRFQVPYANEDDFRRDLEIWLSKEKSMEGSILVDYRICEDLNKLKSIVL